MRFSHGVTRLATHLYKTPVNFMCMLLKVLISDVMNIFRKHYMYM
jgi:hypothetical protein